MDLGLQKKILKYHHIMPMIEMKLKNHIRKKAFINFLATNSHKRTLVWCLLI